MRARGTSRIIAAVVFAQMTWGGSALYAANDLDGQGMPAWNDSIELSSPSIFGGYDFGTLDYAVFAPGTFSFDTVPANEYVYAYQVAANGNYFGIPINALRVGLDDLIDLVDDLEDVEPGDVSYVNLHVGSDVDPTFYTADPGNSVQYDFYLPSSGISSSAVLYFTSLYPPEWDYVSTSLPVGSFPGPSPLGAAEPSSIVLVVIASIALVTWRRQRRTLK